MAAYVDRAYCGWSHEELSERDESQEVSVSQMLDHGSISFGRFAFESLEWERRSVFAYDKRQEELEKFKSPGLVAQKKAYFEDYYKRIRALKAMQEDQHTELTTDYGGDSSISSQTREEDETAARDESHEDGTSNVNETHSKEILIEVSLDRKHNGEATQARHIDLEPASSNLDSSRKDFIEINEEKSNSYALQMHHLDTGSAVHETLPRTEGPELCDLSGFDDKGISRKHDNADLMVEQEQKAFSYDVQIHHLGRESTECEPSGKRKEEIEQHAISGLDDKGISRKHENLELNVEPEVADRGTVLYPTKLNAGKLELKPEHNIVSEKTKPSVKKYKEDHMPFSMVKGTAASVRNGLKLESKAQSDTNSSQGSKYPFLKPINKAKINVGSSSTSADRVSRNYKPSPVGSHRPLTEVRSNVTTPRPFSSAMERRSPIPDGIRYGAPCLVSKTPNGLASSLNLATDVINVQDASKIAARCYAVKGRGLANKRGCEELRKIDLTLASKCTSLRVRGANEPGPPKSRISRSINLPAPNQSNPRTGSEHRSANAVRKAIREEVGGGSDRAGRRGRRTVRRLVTAGGGQQRRRLMRADLRAGRAAEHSVGRATEYCWWPAGGAVVGDDLLGPFELDVLSPVGGDRTAGLRARATDERVVLGVADYGRDDERTTRAARRW